MKHWQKPYSCLRSTHLFWHAEEEIRKGKSLTPREFNHQIGIGGPTQFMSIARLIG